MIRKRTQVCAQVELGVHAYFGWANVLANARNLVVKKAIFMLAHAAIQYTTKRALTCVNVSHRKSWKNGEAS